MFSPDISSTARHSRASVSLTQYAVINGVTRRVAGRILPSDGPERRDVQAVIALVGVCWEQLIYPREDA